MRNHRLIILLIILLISSTGFFLVNTLMASSTVKAFYTFERGSITAINIVSQTNNINFEYKDRKWKMTKPAGYKINEELVDRLAKKLELFEALRTIEKKAKDLSLYSLDKPKMIINFKLKNGNRKTLLVGDETASKFQSYVKDADRDEIFTVSLTDTDIFEGGNPSAFRDRGFIFIDKVKVNSFYMIAGGISKIKLQEYEAGKWCFFEPYNVNAKNDAVKDILKGVTGLKIKDFIEDEPSDLKKYGLDNPGFSIEVGDKDGKRQNINYGLIDDNKKEAFIRLNGENGIFTVSTEEFDPRSIKIGDLLNEAPLSISINKVKTVRINDNGASYEFKRQDLSSEDDVFTFSGKPVKSDDFVALYVDLMALTSDGYDVSNTGKKPEMSITYESREGNDSIRLDLSKRDDISYFLTVDEKPLPFYVTSQKVDLVRRWIRRVTDGW